MNNWRKIIHSGSQAELEALRLSGTDSQVTVPNPGLCAQDLWLHDFTIPAEEFSNYGNWTGWKSNQANLNASLTPWISFMRIVEVDGAPDAIHFPFDISGQNPTYAPDHGPNHGLANTEPNTFPSALVLPQSSDAPYLYVESGAGLTRAYSITSPLINLTDWFTKKLVFYFYLYGSNAGSFKVYTSTSNEDIDGPPRELNYFASSIGPGESLTIDDTLTGPVTQVGPNQIQTSANDAWNRVEVDLASTGDSEITDNEFNTGYIWIVYMSGPDDVSNPWESDFGIGNLFLKLDDYEGTDNIDVQAPSLKVVSEDIRFHNLQPNDPGVPGALYKEDFGGSQSFIKISNGPT